MSDHTQESRPPDRRIGSSKRDIPPPPAGPLPPNKTSDSAAPAERPLPEGDSPIWLSSSLTVADPSWIERDVTTIPAGGQGLGHVEQKLEGLGRRVDRRTQKKAKHAKHSARSTGRNAGWMAAGTLASRLTGFGRLLAVAAVLGQARLADAYNQGNNIPNTIYDLVLGGVLSATLLPVIMESINDEDDDMRSVSAIVTFLTVMLCGITIIFWIAAPFVIDFYLLLAGNGTTVSTERALATSLLRFFTPQVLFLGLITLSTALLNARRRFAAPAFAPVVCNVVTIAVLVSVSMLIHHPSLDSFSADRQVVLILGLGTTAGYLAQLLVQLPSMVKEKIRLRIVWDPKHPALRAVLRLSGWTLAAVATNQASLTLVWMIANRKSGDLSSFTYTYNFMQLPYGVLAVSIASAISPDLAQRWISRDRAGFSEKLSSGLRLTLALMLPAGVGYAIVSQPVIAVALRHGHITAGAAHLDSSMLALFTLGLPGFSTYLLLIRAFQSMRDTRSMFWLYAVENGITVVLAFPLYELAGVKGLVIAWIGSYTLTVPLAWLRLRRVLDISHVTLTSPIARIAGASATMATAMLVLKSLMPNTTSFASSALTLGVLVITGVIALGAGAVLFRSDELLDLISKSTRGLISIRRS